MDGNQLDKEELGDQIIEPKLGMRFDSADELFEFYNNYAYKTGFSVKKRTCKKENGVQVHVSYTCSKEGKNITASDTPLNLPPTQRTGCKAKISARRCADDKWMISVVSLQHNHLNSPSKSRYLKSHKRINTSTKKRVLLNDKAGIRMCKTYGALAVEGGGYENLPYDEKTLRNMLAREKTLDLSEGDATALQDHFRNMQNRDPNFFYRMDLDKGSLKNVFWADNRCREAYKEFGEVVTFDTTYLTNKYDMPFAPFVGVNHHGQSILLGCGLLSNEETDTFVWLFRAWLDCMNGVSPRGIITDQAGAMKNAIEIVFKDTKHRWCLWHIMKKIPKKLSRYDNYVRIKSRMKKAVYDTQCPAEFEERWSEMLEKYESLKQNKWLNKLYKEKNRWVPCFVKTTFWAGMSTTQRSESMNAFSDGYVHSRTSLKQFVEKYDNALRYKKEKELRADARSFSKTIPASTSYKMEKQIQKVYTHAKFREFRNQLVRKMYCEITGARDEIKNGILVQKYDIQEEVYYPKPPENEDEDEDEDGDDDELASLDEDVTLLDREKSDSESESEPEPEVDDDMLMKKVGFQVWFQKDECKIECSCHRFEFRGILCTHAICVLLRNEIYLIPDNYILRRWRKDVRLLHTKVPMNSDSWHLTPEEKRYKELCDYFAELADVVSKDTDKCNDIKKWIREQLIAVGKGSGVEMEINKSNQNDENEVEKLGNPPQVKRKGAPNKNRLKPKQYKKRATKGKENTKVDKANLTEQSMIGNVQTSNGAGNTNFGQLLHFAELQSVGNIRNTGEQFRAHQRSLYGSIGNATTSYGIPYNHSENVAHTHGVFSGTVDNVAPAFGHGVFSGHVDSIVPAFGGAQPWRSAHLPPNAAPTYEDSAISLQTNLSGWFTHKKN